MNEKTSINNDETRVEPGNRVNENEARTNVPESAGRPKNRTARSVAMGGLGMIAGVAGAMGIMAFREAPQIPAPDVAGEGGGDVPAIPEPETLGDIEIATSPDDNMCFNDAFAAAREEVGPNGVFEWRGGVYGTYYAEEWNNFSDEYKEQFSGHDWLAEMPDKTGEPAGVNLAAAPDEEPVGDLAEVSFGEHTINVDEEGNQYITLQDAITGEDVQISPEDLQYAIIDDYGGLVGVVSEEALIGLTSMEEPVATDDPYQYAYIIVDDNGNIIGGSEEYYQEDDTVDILNGLDDADTILVDGGDPAVIDDADETADSLADHDLPDYANDAPIDDIIA